MIKNNISTKMILLKNVFLIFLGFLFIPNNLEFFDSFRCMIGYYFIYEASYSLGIILSDKIVRGLKK